jgi:hypothetical protein
MAEMQKHMGQMKLDFITSKGGKVVQVPHEMTLKMMLDKDGKTVIVPDGMKGEDFAKEMAEAKAAIARIPGDKMSAGQKAQIEIQVKTAIGEAKKARAEAQTYVIQAERGALAGKSAQDAAKVYKLRTKDLKPGQKFVFDYSVNQAKGERNISALMDSLTSDQQFSQRSRGYVFYRDLSSAQKKMLGPVPKGHFELKFSQNGQSLAIHG